MIDMPQGKVALVTGGASGIGRAIASLYVREGAKVVVSDVDTAGGEETVRLLREAGGDAFFIRADVSRAEDGRMLVERSVQAYGRLDIACNNAGIAGPLCPTADYPDEAWQQVIGTNLSGVFYGMKHQIGQMLRQGGGAIVNIASILGQVAFANAPAYTAAKHGVVGLTRAAALEYGAKGLRINAVGPAFIHTPMIAPIEGDEATRQAVTAMHPIGRIGRPEEVAELVVWLSSERASFVTGAYYAVDGGYLAQ
jgi:NAD(P)-dependent dehydrogenase (short-subunit alcohol dehydrogenase family)